LYKKVVLHIFAAENGNPVHLVTCALSWVRQEGKNATWKVAEILFLIFSFGLVFMCNGVIEKPEVENNVTLSLQAILTLV